MLARMGTTSSDRLSPGSPLPAGRVVDCLSGQPLETATLAAGKRGALVMFICNHCPYVVHIRQGLVAAAHDALDQGLAVLAINSNSVVSHPQDGPDHMARLVREEAWRFPFAFDESQAVARAFGAACTPDLFVFDAGGKLAYHGQFDESRPGSSIPPSGRDLRAALAAVASGRPVEGVQKASIGCGIKWK
jgi:hypothetical protein